MAEIGMADQTQNDLNQMKGAAKQAVNGTKSAVKGAKKAAKAASNMNPAKVKAMAIGLLIVVVMYMFMALPNLLFASLESIKDSWETAKYTDAHDGNSLLNFTDFIADVTTNGLKAAGNALKTLGNVIAGLFSANDDADNPEVGLTEDDIDMYESQAAAQLSIVKMGLSTNNKYLMRANHIKTLLDDTGEGTIHDQIISYFKGLTFAGDTWTNDDGEEETYIEDIQVTVNLDILDTAGNADIRHMGTDSTSMPNAKFVEAELNNKIKEFDDVKALDELEKKQEEFTAMVCELFPIERSEKIDGNMGALSLISLFSAQTNTAVSDLSLSDYMQYLGYHDSADGSKTIPVDFGGVGITGQVKKWRGSFIPQYVMEEVNYYRDLKNQIQERQEAFTDIERVNQVKKQLITAFYTNNAETEVYIPTNEEIAAELGMTEDQVQEILDKDEEYRTQLKEVEDKLKMYQDKGMPLMDLIVTLDFPKLDLSSYTSEEIQTEVQSFTVDNLVADTEKFNSFNADGAFSGGDWINETTGQLNESWSGEREGKGYTYTPTSVILTTYTYQKSGAISKIVQKDYKTVINETWYETIYETKWVQEPIPEPTEPPDEDPAVDPSATPAPPAPPVSPEPLPEDYPTEKPDPGYMWVLKTDVPTIKTHTRTVYKMARTFDITYSIYPKDPATIAYMVGLYRGDFNPVINETTNTEAPSVIPSEAPNTSEPPEEGGSQSIT